MKPLEPLASSISDAVRPDSRIWVDEWAEENRVLPADTPEPGPYRNTRTPYLVDVQRTMSPGSPYREGWFQGPHQIGKSVTGENLIGSWICTAAGSILVVFPTLDDAKQWELTRFEPMRANTKELRKRVRAADQKGADNTKLRKKFPGGVMRLVGANRVGALKAATIRYVKFEEPDEYPIDLDGQGSVLASAINRTSNFGRKAKIYGDGTPTFDGRSAINAQVKRGDQRRWHLHCPDCKHAQPLDWQQLRWVDGDPDSAKAVCTACGSLNTEHAWKSGNYAPREPGMSEEQAAAAGFAHWRATAVGEPGVASWLFTGGLSAPIGWRPWAMLASKWIGVQGNDETLKNFVNNFRGECYADKVRSEVGAEQLQQRAEGYNLMTCPQGGLVCVAGVDTQDNRLAVVIRAFGRGEESWGIWHSEIYGDPSSPETWAKLRALLEAPIRHDSGQVMRVDAAAIDAGGHHGEDVYAFCRDAQIRGKHWFAIRGGKSYDAPKIGKPKKIDFTWRGSPVPGGAELRFIGTQSIKNLIDGRLKLQKPGGGYYHNPLAFEADYYKQMRSERREWRRDTQGNKSLWWIKGSERNEAWDCEVYVYAAYLYSMQGQHAETVFRNREKLFGRARQLDLLDDGALALIEEDQRAPIAAGDEIRAPVPLLSRGQKVAQRPRRAFIQRG
jgi:phage terminase large subunit GpA-like protein